MPLTVLSVAFPFASVGPDAVGGAEQVLSALDFALVRAGHRSLVVAAEDSRVAGTLIPTTRRRGRITAGMAEAVLREHRENIERAIHRYAPDIVHLHGVDFLRYLPRPGVPVLVTLHLAPECYATEVFALSRPATFLHCVSSSQRRACPPVKNLLPDIPNGVAVEQMEVHGSKRGYAMALGRICPEKNQHVALLAAQKANLPLLLGGEIFPYELHQRYFATEIEPRLDGQRRFVGPLNLRRKRRLLTGARCLLHPTLANETSSLVAMEALACGTPVVAFASGALPDIIEPGVTGFLVRDGDEMAEAAEQTRRLDPEACRDAARRRFSRDRMLQGYFEAYRTLTRVEQGLAASA
jgi:glycosyltransferase involved in cell wall biosynthesis